jgi:myo-inositol-1(or 4)-monophosphatase
MFYAEKNNGAYFNNQRIRVSKKKKIEECLFATGGKKEINNILNSRKSGSAALDMAYVGAGRYDGYFQKNLNIWDIAAGIIIVKEAGGKINDINYSTIGDHDVFAASNAVYEKMIENLGNF